MSQWHYADHNRQRLGPVENAELARLFQRGEVALDTLVWREGMAGWQPLGDFAAELALLEPAPADDAGDTGSPFEIPARETQDPYRAPDAAAPASPYAAPTAALHSDEGFHASGEVVYAGFWKRVAASFIDGLVIGAASQIVQMLLMVVFMAIGAGNGAFRRGDNPFDGAFGIAIIASVYLLPIALQVFYFAAFHASSKQATLGKMAVGIKVVGDDGRRIGLLRGIARYFGYWLSALILCIGYLMAAFTPRKQALHDLMCATQVVDKWAHTAHPEWQRRELGTATVVILVGAGVLTVLGIAFIGTMIGLVANMGD